MKNEGEKFAAARYPDGDMYEFFNEQDNSINEFVFEEETGIEQDQLDTWYDENEKYIENARMRFSPKGRINHAVENYKSGEYNWSMAMAQINDAIHDMDINNEHDLEISGIDDKGNFVVDIEFIVDATEELLKYINGDEHLDIYNPSVDYRNLFDDLDAEWQNHVTSYIMDNHLGEVEELLDDDEITRSDIERNIDDILENIEDLDDLKSAFNMADEDGSRSGAESNIMSTIMSFIEEHCQELQLSIHKPLFEMIDKNAYTATLSLDDAVSFAESIEDFELGNIDSGIDLGVMDYDYLKTVLKDHIGEAIGRPRSDEE